MEILSFENSAKPARRKPSVLLGIGALLVAGISVLGTTLASSVTITGGTVTFGQGSVQATACDSAITVTPGAEFANASGDGSFRLKTITLGGVDNSACAGKTFIIKAYGDTNTTPLVLWTSNSAITSVINATIGSTTANTGATVSSSGAGIITYTITSPTLAATDVFKITIEQQN